MKIFDTLSQQLKEFVPMDSNNVKMYVCGPTVYDYPHLGHARCYITWDVVARYLRFKGYNLTYVRNITDVDDKIINKARQAKLSTSQIAETYYEEFKKAMKELNIADPDIEPKATDNIKEMIDIIKTLIDKGYAYNVNGDVFFRVGKYNKYGALSRQNIADLESGARVETSDKKEDPLDFTLWKPVKSDDEIGWDSPWGKGRPGWHIECSAMAKKYLGESIDIHAGGQDLMFPHHENERAQSECALGCDFVKNWMHNGFVIINEEKMSKSLGNFVSIKDLLKVYDANTIRLFILTNQYRMPVEFNEVSLKSAKSGCKRLKNAVTDVSEFIGSDKVALFLPEITLIIKNTLSSNSVDMKIIPNDLQESFCIKIKTFIDAMDDDFNTSIALSVLFDIAGCAQKAKDSNHKEESLIWISLLIVLSRILGFDFQKEDVITDSMVPQLMELIISIRKTAREQKNWELSDKIRDELAQINVTLKDHKDGTSWSLSE